jgi:hypothetical protein
MQKKSLTIGTIVFIVLLIMVTCLCQPSAVEGAPIVDTDKDIYNYGEMIKVNFSNSPGNERDWICIVPAGSPDTEAGDYKYMPKGLSQGSLIFDPPSPGKYEARAYYNYSRNGYVVSGRYAFSVAKSPEMEAAMAQRMERKIDPNKPEEADLPPGKGLVYIFREPLSVFPDIQVPIKADGKPIIVIPNSSYYLFSVPAGDVIFTTGNLIMPNGEEIKSDRKDNVMVKVKPGYVYYLKLYFIPVPIWSCFLTNIPHQEGAKSIQSYKLTRIER